MFRSRNMHLLLGTAIAITAFCLTTAFASAQISNHVDVNGLRTFQDASGNVWVDLDNFFEKSAADMRTTVEAAGFTVATDAQVHALLDPLPLTGGEWPTYAAIMGQAPNRGLIWGAYLGTGNLVGWAWSFDSDVAWTINPDSDNDTDVPNGGGPFADLNIWAFQSGVAAVPEPGTYGLLAGMLVPGAAFLIRRRRA